MTTTAPKFRVPYVGDGVDGARRSAQIDREEAELLDRDDPRRGELAGSAERWEDQAAWLERTAARELDETLDDTHRDLLARLAERPDGAYLAPTEADGDGLVLTVAGELTLVRHYPRAVVLGLRRVGCLTTDGLWEVHRKHYDGEPVAVGYTADRRVWITPLGRAVTRC